MKLNETTIPVFLNEDQYKKLLSEEGKIPEAAAEQLFARCAQWARETGDGNELKENYPVYVLSSLLEEYTFAADGRKVFDDFSDIFSFDDYCAAMNLDPQNVDNEDIKAYVQFLRFEFELLGDIVVLDHGGYFYRREAIQKAYDKFKHYDVFHKKNKVMLGAPMPYDIQDSALHGLLSSSAELILRDDDGTQAELKYGAKHPLQAILLEEGDGPADLNRLFYQGSWDFGFDDNFDNYPDDFFACAYSFPRGVKIYNQGELVYEAAADIVRVFRYGECGFIIQLLSE